MFSEIGGGQSIDELDDFTGKLLVFIGSEFNRLEHERMKKNSRGK